MKTCNTCNIEKEITEYWKDTINWTVYIRNKCKKCRYEQRSSQPHYKEWKQEASKKDYSKRKDVILKANREYKKTNKWKIAVINDYTKRKRLKDWTCDWTITFNTLQQRLIEQDYKCRHCNINLRKEWVVKHLDHIIPLSLWGNHAIWNVQYLCSTCNLTKGNKFIW